MKILPNHRTRVGVGGDHVVPIAADGVLGDYGAEGVGGVAPGVAGDEVATGGGGRLGWEGAEMAGGGAIVGCGAEVEEGEEGEGCGMHDWLVE